MAGNLVTVGGNAAHDCRESGGMRGSGAAYLQARALQHRRARESREKARGLARKLDALMRLEVNPSTGASHTAIREKVIESIREHLGPIEKTLDDLKSKLPPPPVS